MSSPGRLAIMAEMHGRDLMRRHVALVLLLALPVSIFLSGRGTPQGGVASGGVSLAFSVGGASMFSALSSARVDQRLVLAGYRPAELVIGRLAFLLPFGCLLAGAFAGLIIVVGQPADVGLTVAGVELVAAQSVPFGLLVAYVVPRELEGMLVLIGVVGIQLATTPTALAAKLLPLYGARRLLIAGYHGYGATLWPVLVTLAWAVVLLVAALVLGAPRLTAGRAD